jgi:hypothetical protein
VTTLREFGKKSWGADVSGEVYVETGLDRGNSLACACAFQGPPFRRLIGIEWDAASADYCRERFKGDPRVEVRRGSSVSQLAAACYPARKTVFWLDAHACGDRPETYSPADGPCPLLAELKVILDCPWKVKPVILIDDAMTYCSAAEWRRRHAWPGFRPEDYPTFGQVFDALGGVDERFTLVVGPGDAPGGVLYCF